MKVPWLLLAKWTAILLLSESSEGKAAPPTSGQSFRRQDVQTLSWPELDRAASDVTQVLKRFYPNDKIVVIGGAALQKYLPSHRPTRVGS